MAPGTLHELANGRDARIFTTPVPDPAGVPTRIRSSSRPSWRGARTGEFFNQQVNFDWLCLSTRAFDHAVLSAVPDDTPHFGPSSMGHARIVNDALVMTDRATRYIMIVCVPSHAQLSECVEKWILRHGAMLTLASDGEPANHSKSLQEVRTTYGIPFERANAPYHAHHNGVVETMVALIRRLTASLCATANLSPEVYWPLAALHAAPGAGADLAACDPLWS